MLELRGKQQQETVPVKAEDTILEHALKHKVNWGFSCTQGNCARCRSLILEGADCLSPPSEAELDRLDEEEIAAGYRLGCQAEIIKDGNVVAVNKTYF